MQKKNCATHVSSENDKINGTLQEDFKDPVTLRNELSKLHIDESSAVLKANADFYRAFRCDTCGCVVVVIMLTYTHTHARTYASKPVIIHSSLTFPA
jgi:hypothetical protein